MSLLSFTVKKARFVGIQAPQWSSYATLKLQSVKSTTVVVKGENPSWEQDFLFELNNLDVGLLIEVWNKGRFWDNVVGYHYLYLSDIHCSNVAGAGQWLSLDAELVMRDGEVVGTKSPTGHVLLVDARFELPLGDVEGDEAVELQWKLEMLNSMLDQEARAEQCRRQQQYYIQSESGVSEDSDYTSDVNYPVGQHPNSSASQYLSAAGQHITRSINSTRENSYENDEEQVRKKGDNVYPAVSPRSCQSTRLLPNIQLPAHSFDLTNDSRNYETDPMYYNSRPQCSKPPYKSNYRTDSFDNGYGYSRPPEPDYCDDYHDAEEFQQSQPRRKPFRRKALSLERQETLYADEDVDDYGPTNEIWKSGQNSQQVYGFPSSTISDCDQYPSRHYRAPQNLHPDPYHHSSTQPESFEFSDQYNSHNYVEEPHSQEIPTTAYVDYNSSNIPGTQESYHYDGWLPAATATSREYYPIPSTTTEYSQPYPPQTQQNQPESKSTFQQQFGLNTLKKTIASVFPSISTHPSPASSTIMLKTQGNASISQKPNVYSDTTAPSHTGFGPATQPYNYSNTNQVVPQTTTSTGQPQFEEEIFDFENWDFTNGYYDESGNFVPYQGYYDESGNFVPTESAPDPGESYYGQPESTGDSAHPSHYYGTGSQVTTNAQPSQPKAQYSLEDTYDKPFHQSFDDTYYCEEDDFENQPSEFAGKDSTYPPEIGSRQNSIQSQRSLDYNYAYQSTDNLTSSFDQPTKMETSLDRSNSVIRRRSFRRQTSTRDYGLEGHPEASQPNDQVIEGTPAVYKQETLGSHRSMSIDDYGGSGWTSQEYVDAEGGAIGPDSYDHYEDAVEDHQFPGEGGGGDRSSGDGPVHMDSLESNSSEPGVRDRDANEKFEAQYWERQRERIAEQATMCSQDSQDYYGNGYDPYEVSEERPQRLESIDETLFSPPPAAVTGFGEKGISRQGSETEWMAPSVRSGRSSLDQSEDWVNRPGSLKTKPEIRRELSRQDTEEQPDVDQEYLGEYDEDEIGHPFMRKHSSVSVDSQGETLPPTSPPPSVSDVQKLESQQVSIDDESVSERKASLDVPGKDKGPKTVSFEEEPPKLVPERHTKGMTSKEKWLWSMNRICSTLQVSKFYTQFWRN